MRSIVVLLAITHVCLGSFPGQSDQITALPGAPAQPGFNMYSGYLEINATTGKVFQYTFVEASEADPAQAPLVRWMNGGPGCSSLSGLMSEVGPFMPDGQGGLTPNPYAWNRKVNLLVVDSPVGVGWSYSKSNSSYTMSDASTAHDNLVALQAFVTKFPQYQGRDFYLSGESYFGHYGMELTSLILDESSFPLNYVGIALGNPTTHIVDDFFYGTWRTWFERGLISTPTWHAIQAQCSDPNLKFLTPPPACQSVLDQANKEMGTKFNPYDLSVQVCSAPQEMHLVKTLYSHMFSYPPSIPYRPCEDNFVSDYLNREDVRSAMHISPSAVPKWSDCTIDPRWNYDYNGFYISQLPSYTKALKAGLRVVLYSGTADTVVPYLGTQRWIWNFFNTSTPVEAWHDWSTPEEPDQLAGYTVKWTQDKGQFRFVTSHLSGHMVPQQSPEKAYSVLNYLLHDTPQYK